MPHELKLCDIHACLARHNALVVHFSSVPNISDFNLFFPDDLKGVIEGNAMRDGLCCSAVKPQDSFHGLQRHAFGSIGVIVDFVSAASLKAVWIGDGGARVVDGKRCFDERPFGLDTLESTLKRPSQTHNEWGVADYIVRGLFVSSPIEVIPTKDTQRCLSFDDVRGLFPEQRIYGFDNDHIVELHPRKKAIRTEHFEIYKK